MRLMPPTMRVSCNDVSAKAALRADVMVIGVGQRFSMRAKPAIIGMLAGPSRIQPSRICGAQSRAHAMPLSAASRMVKTNGIFMRL